VSERARTDGLRVGDAVECILVGQLSQRVERSQQAVLLSAIRWVGTRRERGTGLTAVRHVARVLTIDHIGSDGQDRRCRLGVAIGVMFLHHADESLEQPHCDAVGTVVVVAVAGEVALGLELQGEARLVADDVDLGIFDSRDGVNDMREAGNTRGEGAAHIGVDESHLLSLVEVFVVHVVDEVQRLDIDSGQPLHHIHEAGHELIVGHHVALDRTVGGAHLLTCLAVHATTDGVGEALGEVGTCTEELHLLTRLSSAHAAADAVVIAPDRPHDIIVLVLDRAGLHRDVGSIALESLGQTAAVEHGEVRLGRWSHVLQCVEEAEVVLCHHVAAVLSDACHLERSPYRVAGEELVVRRDTGKLHHAELHHQVVDELLCIILSQRTLVEVACDVDVEEGRDAAHRHGSTVLCLHGSQVTEVEPLYSLAGIGSRFGDVEAILCCHLLEALECLDLHGDLLAQADDLVDHLALAHSGEVFLLLLNETVDTVEGYTTVVTHDAATAVGVGQTSEDMVVTHMLHLRRVSVEDTVVVRLDIFMEDFVDLFGRLIAIGGAGLLSHLDAAVGHEGALQRLVGLKAYDTFEVFGLLVDVAGAISSEPRDYFCLHIEDTAFGTFLFL